MKIKKNQKWICFIDCNIFGDGDSIHFSFKKGDIIQITEIDLTEAYPYYTDYDFPLDKKELLGSFILLAKWRDMRINEILDD